MLISECAANKEQSMLKEKRFKVKKIRRKQLKSKDARGKSSDVRVDSPTDEPKEKDKETKKDEKSKVPEILAFSNQKITKKSRRI